MNHMVGNEQFTVLKNATYRRHLIQSAMVGALVMVVIYAAITWYSTRKSIDAPRVYDNINVPHEEVQRLAWTLAEALDPAVGQPFTYSQVLTLLSEDWQPLRDEIELIINQ